MLHDAGIVDSIGLTCFAIVPCVDIGRLYLVLLKHLLHLIVGWRIETNFCLFLLYLSELESKLACTILLCNFCEVFLLTLVIVCPRRPKLTVLIGNDVDLDLL